MTAPAKSALEAAVAAVEAADVNGAVTQLLAAWRATREPRIAELLDAVTLRLPPRALAIECDGEAAQRAWLDLALAERPEDLPALLDTLVVPQEKDEDGEIDWVKPSIAAIQTAERVWALETRDDPRVAHGIVTLLGRPPFLAPRGRRDGIEEFWGTLEEALRKIGDARAARPLEDFAAGVCSMTSGADAWANDNCYTHRPIGPMLAHWLPKLAAELRAIRSTPLVAEEAALCAKLEARLAKEIEALFTAELDREAAAKRAIEDAGQALDNDDGDEDDADDDQAPDGG